MTYRFQLAAAVALMCGAGAFAQTTYVTEPATTGMTPTVAPESANLVSFDVDKDGVLSPLEFGQMVMASRATASGGALAASSKRQRYGRASHNSAIKLLNATSEDFTKTDQNHDQRVSQDELAMIDSSIMAPRPDEGLPPK